MAITPNLALPYPGLTDSPNVPRDVAALANAVDAKMQFQSVVSTSQIVSPYDGQIVYNLTDGISYVWNSSAATWWRLGAYARYARTSGTQAVATGTILQFPTAIDSDPRIIAGGTGNSQFTLVAGRWKVSAAVRLDVTGADAVMSVIAGVTYDEGNTIAMGPVSNSALLNVAAFDIFELDTATTVSIGIFCNPARNVIPYGNPSFGVTHVSFERSV